MAIVGFWPDKLRRRHGGKGLDKAIFHWNKFDSLTLRGLVAGGIIALGRTSSGKTSSMKGIAKAILKLGNSSMLVMCAKQGEADEWLKYCEEMGREKDVVLFGVDQPARFNMVGYEADRGGVDCTQQIVRFISEMRSVILREPVAAGGDAQFWRKQDERGLTHAVTLLRTAGTAVTPMAIHDLIMTAPQTLAQRDDPNWATSPCYRALVKARGAPKTSIELHDFDLARDYFTREWPEMGDRTRASILVGTIGTLTAMNTGLCRELFANYSNMTPKDAFENRKIVIIDLPPDEFGDTGRIGNVGWKYHWQREVLRRQITEDSPITCIWGDEASEIVAPSDTAYLSRCRSYRGCMVYITQSLDSFHEVMPGEKGKSAVEAMLTNFSHRLIFALGDITTATWAADLCGKELEVLGGGGTQYGEMRPFLYSKPQYSSSFSEQWNYLIQPSRFLNGFRTGTARNNFLVDALLLRSGEPFSNGLPIIQVTFDQRT
jgi:hypothetical protein